MSNYAKNMAKAESSNAAGSGMLIGALFGRKKRDGGKSFGQMSKRELQDLNLMKDLDNQRAMDLREHHGERSIEEIGKLTDLTRENPHVSSVRMDPKGGHQINTRVTKPTRKSKTASKPNTASKPKTASKQFETVTPADNTTTASSGVNDLPSTRQRHPRDADYYSAGPRP